jgi:hypothetical protein
MGWILFVLLLTGGIVVYYFLAQMEQEIRAELTATEDPEPHLEKSTTAESRQNASDESLDTLLCGIIQNSPGILQTDLYQQLPDIDKKLVQKELLMLDRSGNISRVRSGNTYQLNLKN